MEQNKPRRPNSTPGSTLLLQTPYERSDDASWCPERPHQGLVCLGEGCNLKRCLWASLWGFSSLRVCWLNVSCCLHLSGLWIESFGSLLQSMGELLMEKHCAKVMLLLRVVGKNIYSSALSDFSYVLSLASYFSKLVFVWSAPAWALKHNFIWFRSTGQTAY